MVNRRLHSSLLAVPAAIIGLASLFPQPAEAQTTPASAKKWTVLRTPDGQPDLQGIWTNATITPFERPAALAGKAFFSEQEAAAFEALAAKGRVDGPGKPGDVGSYNQAWSDGGTTVVSTRQTALVVDPPDGRVPVKPWAEEKRAYDLAHVADSWEHMSVWDRCITRGVPGGMFPAGYNNAYQILQIPGYVVIFYEMIHETRIIPIDGRPKLGAAITQWNGEPRGRWEGNTLVVESTNYNDKGSIGTSAATGRMRGIPQSASMKITERFTPVGPDTIDYRVTIDDPKVYARPWTVELPLNRDETYQMFEYSCQEGNYAMANALSFGRKRDREAAAGATSGK